MEELPYFRGIDVHDYMNATSLSSYSTEFTLAVIKMYT